MLLNTKLDNCENKTLFVDDSFGIEIGNLHLRVMVRRKLSNACNAYQQQ